MRQIKFRKWSDYIDGKKGMVDNTILGGQTLYNLTKEDDDILMQFTGLLDKNGVEIYEGDVVLHHGVRYRVEWHVGKFRIYPIEVGIKQDNGTYTKEHTIHEHMSTEVVGNIYENPELLANSK